MSNVIERIDNGELTSYVIEIVIGERGVKDVESRNDLADELLRLAKLGQRMQWVSVDESLPNNDRNVLVFHDGHYSVAWNGESGQWWKDGQDIYRVTHWMPLPPNPEGVE